MEASKIMTCISYQVRLKNRAFGFDLPRRDVACYVLQTYASRKRMPKRSTGLGITREEKEGAREAAGG